MKLYLNGKTPVTASKCYSPTFKNIRGRTWDCGSVNIDGVKTEVWLDTTWGHYMYFKRGTDENGRDQWYKVLMVTRYDAKVIYDIDPFSSRGEDFSTTPNL
jgi:hypothetical protein